MLIQRLLILAVAVATVLLLGNWTYQDLARAKQDEAKGERHGKKHVTLRLSGDHGVPFSGVCSLGEKRREISGQTPRSFEFDPKGRELSCEISTQDTRGEELEVVLNGEGIRSVQQLGGAEGAVRLTYSGDGSFSSISSTSQMATGTTGSSSSADDATPGEDNLKGLADRIEQNVEDILERVMP
ncbi:MAG: hypothetical protein AVDCRST_MAG58-761 [uncultured Rubrobacteraceae bacterium]|uniref:Uncharacterized protein n=1 Tax=uncultured Rubrobacteraceae bacterium TaxID=349277 RepID=A0A6J4QNZ9_9ACTN|nr:MAG: hypothetical protein AVDCRST_MAG58-761 [uncultured Rubrobacteraceae bacterium]